MNIFVVSYVLALSDQMFIEDNVFCNKIKFNMRNKKSNMRRFKCLDFVVWFYICFMISAIYEGCGGYEGILWTFYFET